MKDYGKAVAKVEILSELPYLVSDKLAYDFDCGAGAWNMYKASPFMPPFLVENILDAGDTSDQGEFAACFPAKRKYYVDNYITDDTDEPLKDIPDDSTKPYILFKPISTKEGFAKSLIDNTENPYLTYTLEYPGKYPKTTGAYNGPQWRDDARTQEAPPNDEAANKEWEDLINKGSSTGGESTAATATTDTTETEVVDLPKISYINQTVTGEGLWWAVESNDFLNENMPFWVTIKRSASPSSKKYESFIIISIGIGSVENAYDLYISNNKKPALYDYYLGREGTGTVSSGDSTASGTGGMPNNKMKEFPTDFSKIFDDDKNIEIGFMTCGGRLVVFANKTTLVYTKIQTLGGESRRGKLLEAKIEKGKIRIYGSNCSTVINVSPMTFAFAGALALPVATMPAVSSAGGTEGGTSTPVYNNVKYDGTIGNDTVGVLPQEPSVADKLYGIDCKTFYDGGISATPLGFGFHKTGYIWFTTGTKLGVTASEASDFYGLLMMPEDVTATFSDKDIKIINGGCPYFFKIKGGYRNTVTAASPGPEDISEYVMSVSESYQADDYFAISGSAQIVLYNKNKEFDYLKDAQKGIQISWGWNDYALANNKTFTGLIVSATSNETPGKETMTLSCQDYQFVLKNTMMMNSPFYDGMVLYYAAKDVAKRAGLTAIENDWDDTNEYFLPSGYAFTKPAVKFDDYQDLYSCIKSMCERAEAIFYFDKDGKLRIKKLDGGLYSSTSGTEVVANFTRDPTTTAEKTYVILDEKNVEYDLSDTVNTICIYTLDRDTRNAIVVNKVATTDKLLYRRVFWNEEAALGDFDTAVERADELSQRLFFPIKKTSFKTVGVSVVIYPFSFIKIDGEEFRLMGLSRKYSADSNDFTMEYNAEWLGGS